MLPPGLTQQADLRVALADESILPKTAAEKRVLALLKERGPLRGRQLEYHLPRLDWRRAVDALTRRGALSRESILSAPAVRPRRIRTVTLTSPSAPGATGEELGSSTDSRRRRKAVLDLLAREPGPLHVNWIYAETGATANDLRFLEQHDVVSLGETEVWRDPLADLDYIPTKSPKLTADQAAAWEQIRPAFDAVADPPLPFLLHGVTASGKTEIYLRAIDEALKRGRTALVLVPEIAMTPLTVARLMSRFPGRVGLLHSRLSDGERYDTWRRCRSGMLPIVLGPRSALFAPLPNLGLVVLDEEHDELYKEQGLTPHYHAREVAMAYARIVRGVCILGSATPDVETTFRAERGRIVRLRLPQRILGHRARLRQQSNRLGVSSHYSPHESDADAAEMPPVRIVDMRLELKAGNASLFSRSLQQALQETLEARSAGHLVPESARRGDVCLLPRLWLGRPLSALHHPAHAPSRPGRPDVPPLWLSPHGPCQVSGMRGAPGPILRCGHTARPTGAVLPPPIRPGVALGL